MRRLALGGLGCALISSAAGQQGFFGPGQPIIFSSTDTNVVGTGLSSLAPKPPGLLGLQDAIQAPPQLGSVSPSAAPMAPGPGMISPAEAARIQNLQDRQNNWILLTPAEILGSSTPEAILGIANRDAFGDPKTPTAMERYTERQDRSFRVQTNRQPLDTFRPAWDFLSQRGQSNDVGIGLRPAGDSGMQFNPSPDTRGDGGAWAKLFNAPGSTPAFGRSLGPVAAARAEAARQDDMDRFRQLLNPVAAAPPPADPGSEDLKTSLPRNLLGADATLGSPLAAGIGIATLHSGVGRPSELPRLPSIWSMSYTSAPPGATWSQPVPWQEAGPQPFAAPQRKF